jgi:hypothetical protein
VAWPRQLERRRVLGTGSGMAAAMQPGCDLDRGPCRRELAYGPSGYRARTNPPRGRPGATTVPTTNSRPRESNAPVAAVSPRRMMAFVPGTLPGFGDCPGIADPYSCHCELSALQVRHSVVPASASTRTKARGTPPVPIGLSRFPRWMPTRRGHLPVAQGIAFTKILYI